MLISLVLFFFNDTATTEIYTLSLHDALPIWLAGDTEPLIRTTASRLPSPADRRGGLTGSACRRTVPPWRPGRQRDRKSTRLNSSHANISYAVFCLKKKKRQE